MKQQITITTIKNTNQCVNPEWKKKQGDPYPTSEVLLFTPSNLEKGIDFTICFQFQFST